MPPKKRSRVSQVASPDPISLPKSPTPAAETSPDNNEEENEVKPVDHVLVDPWTDEEEIGLFKGIMRWKPTGIHKHFRILALHNWLLENHYIHPSNTHTRPAGIRAKLGTLYDLETLDAREDARQLSKLPSDDPDDDDDSAYSEAANKIETTDFSLPHEDDGFDELMWKQRFAKGKSRSESPPALAELNLADEPPIHFTPCRSIEPSETATSVSRRGRRAGARGRAGRPANVGAPRRRSARQAESVEDESENDKEDEDKEEEEEEKEDSEEEEGKDENDEGESEEEEDEEGEDSSSEEESQESTPAPRATRGAKGKRGRGAQSSSAQASRRTRKRQR